MAQKKVFALRLNKDVYVAVERWAADEFRSTNGQLEWIINRALQQAGRNKLILTSDQDAENDNNDE